MGMGIRVFVVEILIHVFDSKSGWCVLSEGGLQCNASVSGLSLLGGLHWLSIRQPVCLAIIRDCLWTSKGFRHRH